MTGKQYNNLVRRTIANNKPDNIESSAAVAKAIFNNCGVAFPAGDCPQVLQALMTNDYMGWRLCSYLDAQKAANAGVAATGINTNRVIVITPDTPDLETIDTTFDINSDTLFTQTVSNTEPDDLMTLQFYAYTATATDEDNLDYRGLQILTSSQLTSVNNLKSFYQSAGQTYGVPWQMIAAIHYREYSLQKAGPSNGLGPYQISGKTYPVGPYTDAQFQTATNDVAQFIKGKAGSKDLSISDNIKYTFFAYNGTSSLYKTQAINLGFTTTQANNGEGSPYVMNRYDLKRDPTVEPTKSNNTWGQIKTDGGSLSYPANSDYGAFIVYGVCCGL